ncbi:MAG: tRNA (adenosine(37)-N6)-threonylcarbamoyltransferase complex transferase subunit TsaD [Firmicutes bacterium]|nr:tRNA (adenosine(37)-N6)-threonylcarbamoyltransferase complex transferase subunit TsaD [Bacillota bacterium]
MKIVMGIETSCDETAAGIVTADGKIQANVISSQIPIHKIYGGVVPEIASRNHIRVINVVVAEAIASAGIRTPAGTLCSAIKLSDITAIAATAEPGLPGAVMLGRLFGESLAHALNIPFYPVHHILGHIASVPLSNNIPLAAHLSLVVSGGHTALYDVSAGADVKLLETTTDDAVGEAFDKVARVLGLSYPGGPEISKMAAQYTGTDHTHFVAKPNYHRNGFSYSGLKTAVINYLNRAKMRNECINIPHIAASFQAEATAQILYKVRRALDLTKHKTLCVGGGVSANTYLRNELTKMCTELGVTVLFPKLDLTGDNGAMIAAAAIHGLRFI